jgi:hypothetical protein
MEERKPMMMFSHHLLPYMARGDVKTSSLAFIPHHIHLYQQRRVVFVCIREGHRGYFVSSCYALSLNRKSRFAENKHEIPFFGASKLKKEISELRAFLLIASSNQYM